MVNCRLCDKPSRFYYSGVCAVCLTRLINDAVALKATPVRFYRTDLSELSKFAPASTLDGMKIAKRKA